MLCPTCGPDLGTVARHSKECSKMIYLGHTQYLPLDHPWRRSHEYFLDEVNGGDDQRPIPVWKDSTYWMRVWDRVNNPNDPLRLAQCGIVSRSVLHDLEYWRELKIIHLLDPMHIEGNMGKSLVKHLFGVSGKAWTKACIENGVHHHLWPYRDPESDRVWKPIPEPTWVLSPHQRSEFRRGIGAMHFPTGYGTDLRRAFGGVDTTWPSFLKTHDWHRLL